MDKLKLIQGVFALGACLFTNISRAELLTQIVFPAYFCSNNKGEEAEFSKYGGAQVEGPMCAQVEGPFSELAF